MFFDWIGMFSQTLEWITYCIATLVISSLGIIVIIIIIITDRNYETEFINKLTHLPFCRYLSQFNWGTGIGKKIATVDTMLYAYSHFLFSHTMQIISFYWIIACTHTRACSLFWTCKWSGFSDTVFKNSSSSSMNRTTTTTISIKKLTRCIVCIWTKWFFV